jgi:hypothetical protein
VIRFVFALLILGFGSCTFLAGVCAPVSVREPLASVAHGAARKAGGLLEELVNRITGRPTAFVARPIPYRNLLLGGDPSAVHAFGLQIALEPDAESAAARGQQLRANSQSAQVFPLGSGIEPDAYLLAAGPFSTLAAARQAAFQLAPDIPRGATPLVIVWPPDAAPAASSSPLHPASASASPSAPPSNPGASPPP